MIGTAGLVVCYVQALAGANGAKFAVQSVGRGAVAPVG